MKLIFRMKMAACLLSLLLAAASLFGQTFQSMIQNLNRDGDTVPTLRLRRIATGGFQLSSYNHKTACRVPVSDSMQLIRTLRANGLKEVRYLDPAHSILVFDRDRTIRWQDQAIRLREKFFENAVILKEQVDEQTKRLVIFVADPHGSNDEIPLLKSAILHIFRQNHSTPFYFLNEGYYWNPSREVSLDGARQVLAAGIPVAYQAHQLSQRFIIDLAMECRLQLDRDVKEFAIDDADHISNTLGIEKKYTTAPIDSLYIWRANALKYYYRRDTSMATNINVYLDRYPREVPFIFIGDLHYDGIRAQLPRDVGSLYISVNQEDFSMIQPLIPFDSLRFLNSRENTLKKFAAGSPQYMKLPVSPAPGEWALIRSGLGRINTSFESEAAALKAPFDNETSKALLSAVRTNPYLQDYEVRFVDRKLSTVANDQEIFAKIEEGQIVFYNDGRFVHNEARMNFLQDFRPRSDLTDRRVQKYIDDKSSEYFESFFTRDREGHQVIYMADLGNAETDLRLFRWDILAREHADILYHKLQDNLCKN